MRKTLNGNISSNMPSAICCSRKPRNDGKSVSFVAMKTPLSLKWWLGCWSELQNRKKRGITLHTIEVACNVKTLMFRCLRRALTRMERNDVQTLQQPNAFYPVAPQCRIAQGGGAPRAGGKGRGWGGDFYAETPSPIWDVEIAEKGLNPFIVQGGPKSVWLQRKKTQKSDMLPLGWIGPF
jgi:hypothetical protein